MQDGDKDDCVLSEGWMKEYEHMLYDEFTTVMRDRNEHNPRSHIPLCHHYNLLTSQGTSCSNRGCFDTYK